MASVIQTNFRLRKNYGKTASIIQIPNLICIQKRSYDQFLQSAEDQTTARKARCPEKSPDWSMRRTRVTPM